MTEGAAEAVFVAAECLRADGLTGRIVEIESMPDHPSTGSLPLYRLALRDALRNAAAGEPTAEWGRDG